MTKLFISLSLLLLTGCVSSSPMPGAGDATFVHPETGEVIHCDKPMAGGFLQGGFLAPMAYGECKDNAEKRGFVRAYPVKVIDHLVIEKP